MYYLSQYHKFYFLIQKPNCSSVLAKHCYISQGFIYQKKKRKKERNIGKAVRKKRRTEARIYRLGKIYPSYIDAIF